MRPHYATGSIRQGVVSKLTLATNDLVRRIANPCLSPLANSYLTIVSEAYKQVGVNRAATLLENTIIGVRSDTRSRVRVAALLAAESL